MCQIMLFHISDAIIKHSKAFTCRILLAAILGRRVSLTVLEQCSHRLVSVIVMQISLRHSTYEHGSKTIVIIIRRFTAMFDSTAEKSNSYPFGVVGRLAEFIVGKTSPPISNPMSTPERNHRDRPDRHPRHPVHLHPQLADRPGGRSGHPRPASPEGGGGRSG